MDVASAVVTNNNKASVGYIVAPGYFGSCFNLHFIKNKIAISSSFKEGGREAVRTVLNESSL